MSLAYARMEAARQAFQTSAGIGRSVTMRERYDPRPGALPPDRRRCVRVRRSWTDRADRAQADRRRQLPEVQGAWMVIVT